ncbi:MAG: SusC/RagA family TonB-linked outer membrane protein [Bacteroidales bacterium]|nr:SusC/RagA family TonB-linked outer membrane protein [Bacteroidales bacterium]
MKGIRYIVMPLALLASGFLHAQEPADSIAVLPWNTTLPWWKTASVVTPVSIQDAEKSPVYDLRNKLTGLIPGVEVREDCGAILPSSNMVNSNIAANTVQLSSHGMSSIVLIVDDILVPFNQYQFDWNQVESITMLTGATAKALYGPRAGAGALYVTTRKGSWNQPLSITADVRSGVDFVDRMPEWVNAYEYAVLNNEARASDGYQVLYDSQALAGYAKGDPFSRKYPAVDYRSFMLRNRKTTQNFSFGLTGGSNMVKYNVSLNGYRSDDIFNAGPFSDYDKLSASSAVTAKIGKWIVGSVSFNGMTAFRRGHNGSLTGFRSVPGNAFPVAVGISTNDSELDDVSAGNTIYTVSRAYTTNPYAQLVDGGFYTGRFRSGMFNASIDFDMGWLLKGLKSRTLVDFDSEYYQKVGKSNDYIAYYWSPETDIAEISTHVGTKQASKSTKDTHTYNNLSFYERLTWDWASGDHKLGTGALFFLSDGSNSADDYYERQAYTVANARYSYKDRYFAEIVGQYAGSDRFVAGNRYAFFPSAALSWLASGEDFLKDAAWLDRLKLSVDVGNIGNPDVFGSKYLYRAAYVSASGNNFGPATAYQWFGSDKRTSQTTTISRLENHSLTWPTIFQADLKLDARLLGCLDLGINFYRLRHKGLITDTSAEFASMTGLTNISVYGNHNENVTIGIDFLARYTREAGDWYFSAAASLMSWSTVYAVYANDFYIYDWQRVTGTRHGSYRGFECLGKFESEAEIASSPLYDPDTRVGDLKYRDLNDDGKIDENDKKVVGNTSPLFRGSLTFDVRYKDWSLFVVGSGCAGFDVPLTNEYFWNGWGDGNYSAFVRDNIGGDYPRLGYDKSGGNFVASDFWLRDGSYFKLQTVELAYTLVPRDAKVLKRVKFSLRGANLLTLTGIKYVDPENYNAGVTTYPLFRTVAAGVKMEF